MTRHQPNYRLDAICPSCRQDIHTHPAFDTSEDDSGMPFSCRSRCPKCGAWLQMTVVEEIVRTKRYALELTAPLAEDGFAGERGAWMGDDDDGDVSDGGDAGEGGDRD